VSGLALVVLALATIAMRAAGPAAPTLAGRLARHATGLAPALLAALIVTQLVDDDGLPAANEASAGIAVAAVLVVARAPTVLCVAAAALVTGLLRL
jgi:hypothetical protein